MEGLRISLEKLNARDFRAIGIHYSFEWGCPLLISVDGGKKSLYLYLREIFLGCVPS